MLASSLRPLSLQKFLAIDDRCVDLGIASTDPVIALIHVRLNYEVVAIVPLVCAADLITRRKQVTEIAYGDRQPCILFDLMESKIEAKLNLKLSDAAPKICGGSRIGDMSTTPVTIATEDDWSSAVAIMMQWCF